MVVGMSLGFVVLVTAATGIKRQHVGRIPNAGQNPAVLRLISMPLLFMRVASDALKKESGLGKDPKPKSATSRLLTDVTQKYP